MPATLEAPSTTRKQRKRTPGTWNAEQAQAARAKSLETRRKNAIERKRVKEKAAQFIETLSASDPLTHVETALAAAAKRGNAKACEHLALAVSRLRRTPEPVTGPSPLSSSVSYTPTSSVPVKSTYASTPQSAQHVQYQPSTVQPDFAQYAQPLKESIASQTVPTGYLGRGDPGSGVGGVIETITRGPLPQDKAGIAHEIAVLEQRLAQLKQAQVQSVHGYSEVNLVNTEVGSAQVQPVKPVEEMERFCVNGHWILGKRVK